MISRGFLLICEMERPNGTCCLSPDVGLVLAREAKGKVKEESAARAPFPRLVRGGTVWAPGLRGSPRKWRGPQNWRERGEKEKAVSFPAALTYEPHSPPPQHGKIPLDVFLPL